MHEDLTDMSYFGALVADPDQIPLFEAAAALAQDAYPGLDLQQVLSDLDVIAQRLAARCRHASTETARLQIATEFLYKEMRFEGNVNNYYDPDNSFVHKVMASRRGIPISLAVIFIELARTIGLDADGISFPGHFLIKITVHDGAITLDPFTGRSLTRDDIEERLDPFRASLRKSGARDISADMFLRVAPPRDILLRMLGNLHAIYQQQRQTDKVARIKDRMQMLGITQQPD